MLEKGLRCNTPKMKDSCISPSRKLLTEVKSDFSEAKQELEVNEYEMI